MSAIDWRWAGAKSLALYLASSTGEAHDAAVYDTGYEFDPHNNDAVRFIASLAMTKASLGMEDFEARMPEDGSVGPYNYDGDNAVLRKLKEERAFREANAEGPCIYVPDSSAYCQKVAEALTEKTVPYDDMTQAEREEYLSGQTQREKEEKKFEFWHHYFPMTVAILLACIGFFGILIKLTS